MPQLLKATFTVPGADQALSAYAPEVGAFSASGPITVKGSNQGYAEYEDTGGYVSTTLASVTGDDIHQKTLVQGNSGVVFRHILRYALDDSNFVIVNLSGGFMGLLIKRAGTLTDYGNADCTAVNYQDNPQELEIQCIAGQLRILLGGVQRWPAGTGTIALGSLAAGGVNYLQTRYGGKIHDIDITDGVSNSGTLSGNAAMGNGSAAGGGEVLPPSSLSGDAAMGNAGASGNLGTQLGKVVTSALSRNPGLGGRWSGLTNLAVAVLSDDANLTRLAGAQGLAQALDGTVDSGRILNLPLGTRVALVVRSADGKYGIETFLVE